MKKEHVVERAKKQNFLNKTRGYYKPNSFLNNFFLVLYILNELEYSDLPLLVVFSPVLIPILMAFGSAAFDSFTDFLINRRLSKESERD